MTLSRLWIAITLLALACASVHAQSAVSTKTAPPKVAVNIEAQPIRGALQVFGKQTGIQVLFRTENVSVEGMKTPRVTGELTAQEALDRLLANTGLKYEFVNEHTVRISSARPLSDVKGTDELISPNTISDPGPPEDTKNSGKTSSEAEKTKLEEIVVTAQKRNERLQDVPSSLAALSGKELQIQGVTGFADYMTLVPSLSDFSGGSQGHGAVILRGLNTGYYQTSNTVGFYVDDIPFSATSPISAGALLTPDPDLSDIDHLEVLRGPQATLYGASTLGGLIKTVTKRPDLNDFTGEVQLDGSSIDHGSIGYGVVGIANLPLIPGQLALRISGFDRDLPGYMTNVQLGSVDRDVSRKEGGRVALRWEPAEGLDVQLNAFRQTLKVNGFNYEYVNLQGLAPLYGPYKYSAAIDPYFHTTYALYNLTVHYTMGSLGTLTNSTSYASYQDHEVEDYSPYFGFLNAFAPVPPPANAAQAEIFGPNLNKLSEELRFAARRVGPIEWLGGLFFTREQIKYLYQLANIVPPNPAPIAGPDSLLQQFVGPSTYKEHAVFANVTYYFTDTLNFTAGGRYSHNEQILNAAWSGFLGPNALFPGSTSDTDFTYLAALSYKLTPTVNTYVRVASSYRPGGPEWHPVPELATFKPDSLVNYELGVKGEWPEQNLRANLAVYYMDWKDLQLYITESNGDTAITNAGRASSKGVEFEGGYAPVQGLSFGVALAYTDAALDSVPAGVSVATGAVSGNSLPYTPKWSGSATADYVRPVNGKLSANFGATFRYQGSKWSDYPGDPYNTGVVIPAYRTLGLRTGFTWDSYAAQLRVSNIFNEKGLDTVVEQRGNTANLPAWASIIQPRTVTLSFNASF